MYSGHAVELGTGMGDVTDEHIDGDEIDGFFGSIFSAIKSVAAPALGFVGGAVGTIVAPGLGTAAGAYLGGKLGGAVASSGGGGGGGGGGGAPARRSMTYTPPRPSSYAPRRVVVAPKPKAVVATSRSFTRSVPAAPSVGMSPAAKIAIGTGGVGAAAALAFFAYRASMT